MGRAATNVVEEAGAQAQQLASELREQVREQTRVQGQRLADNVRSLARELEQMGEHGEDGSLATSVVRRLADGGLQVADHLEERGPQGLLDEVQDFARHRPGRRGPGGVRGRPHWKGRERRRPTVTAPPAHPGRLRAVVTMLAVSAAWPHSIPPKLLLAAYTSESALAPLGVDFADLLRQSVELTVSGLTARRENAPLGSGLVEVPGQEHSGRAQP
ncbi:hypothetical protein ACIRVF_31490 [Kitasatospora sp. NPDC101157]|uniref:hypothetical protein n=1 Tax=Kitasatospora sp. NPDC101157 TaxID=3364098 RepID=UPI00382401E0